MLIELGVRPGNILGIDLRQSAIDYARLTNPAIAFQQIGTLDDWPKDKFDISIQCTAFSSIVGRCTRLRTAELMKKSVGDAGYIIWWDIIRANDFAGGDVLDPTLFFSGLNLLVTSQVSLRPSLRECIRPLRGLGPFLASALCRFGYAPTHCIALFGPKSIPQ
jgi:hypothetical protein